jgi:phage tail sheath protein FI
MPEYLSPGVYIEEIRTGPVPIEGVGTSTAGFVGQTVRGPTEAKLVTSWLEYQRWYGGLTDISVSYLPWAVQGFFDNGGQRAFIARVVRDGAASAFFDLETAAGTQSLHVEALGPGEWGNRLFVRVDEASQQGKVRLTIIYFTREPDPFVDPLDPEQFGNPNRIEPTATEDYDNLDVDPRGPGYILNTVNATSQLVELSWIAPDEEPALPTQVAFADAALDGGGDGADAATVPNYVGTEATADDPAAGLTALGAIDEIALLCVPDEVVLPEIREQVLLQCEQLKDRFAALQFPQGQSNVANLRIDRPSLYAAIYWPWIRVFDPRTQDTVLVPPSGHVLGIYARTDTTRGVHKAPANEDVRGIVTRDLPGNRTPLEFKVTKGQQDVLNPRNINVIRDFRADGRGIRVWGARTTATDPDWKYVNVRRLFIFLEESIDQGTQFVVFEPNYEATWAIVRRSISNFLTRVWRDGALAGTTPEEAFFVRCDRTTMTPDDIDNGRLICYIGVAPVKPAEFVIFRISQKTLEAVPA